jgi:HD superfamily phosphohydrolase
MTYHGAEHSRFSHLLGVFSFAQRILEHLQTRYRGDRQILNLLKQHGDAVKAAALLHDVGHGPFSHLVERAFGKHGYHEKNTSALITSESCNISGILKRHGIEPNDVRAIIDKTFSVWFLKDIVSSQLDADRMDYLLRDTLMTGVEYGRYDSEWLIHCLCLGLEPDRNLRNEPNHLRLCLDENRGHRSAEQLIMARMHMSLQVYYHKVTRGWEAHLLCMLSEAARLCQEKALSKDTPPELKVFLQSGGRVSAAAFLEIDETSFFSAFHVWARANQKNTEYLRSLAASFLLRKKLFFLLEPKNLDELSEMIKTLEKLGRENLCWLRDSPSFQVYKDLAAFFGSSGGLRAEDDEEVSMTSILMASGEKGKRSFPIESHPQSNLFRAMGEQKEIGLHRFYVHQSLLETSRLKRFLA